MFFTIKALWFRFKGQTICFRCGLQIKKGTPFVKAKYGMRAHFKCTMSAIGNALDTETNV